MIASSLKKNSMLLVVLIGSVLAKSTSGDCAIVIDILKDLKMYKKPGDDTEKGFECCKQNGVTCNKKKDPPTVTELEWDKKDIDEIPRKIGQLKNLQRLDLRGNLLTDIPIELSNLKSLKYLDISDNQLRNIQFFQFESFTKLEELYLQQNGMRGPIPDSFWGMTNLIVLNLRKNRLEGNLSENIEKLKFLEELYLDSNEFTGDIPKGISKLNGLTELILTDNNFSGSIPTDILESKTIAKIRVEKNPLLKGPINPRCGMKVYISGTSLVICGCASIDSPASYYPADDTPLNCLASSYSTKMTLRKRVQVFTRSLGPYIFTCNKDEESHPFQDCINSIGFYCNLKYNTIQTCKDTVNVVSSQLNPFWQAVRKDCGKWGWNDADKIQGSGNCTQSFSELAKQGYYKDEENGEYIEVKISNAFVESVRKNLFDRINQLG